mmetsp:Transcript_12416/g.34179  ORF Transcript_12416/g.34179 Transcript_12416/m.34179 type:complete len:81 (-) Transcript_12416:266-508(-)
MGVWRRQPERERRRLDQQQLSLPETLGVQSKNSTPSSPIYLPIYSLSQNTFFVLPIATEYVHMVKIGAQSSSTDKLDYQI